MATSSRKKATEWDRIAERSGFVRRGLQELGDELKRLCEKDDRDAIRGSRILREELERWRQSVEVLLPAAEDFLRRLDREREDQAGSLDQRIHREIVARGHEVVGDGMVLGKPSSPQEARAMLVSLRGREHEVITGVAVVDAESGRAASTTVVSRVLMAAYPDATIETYVTSGAPLDKAGAYAIQDLQGALVDGIVGSYTNVIGLPVETTRRLLEGFGVVVSERSAP